MALKLTAVGLLLSFVVQGKLASPWTGKYTHVNDQFEMIVDQWDVDGLSVDIIKKDEPNKVPPYASFVAFVKGPNVAEHRNIREPSCRILLKRVEDGIVVDDYCGGSTRDAGLYRKKNE